MIESKTKNYPLVIGIDISTGTRSNIGVAVIRIKENQPTEIIEAFDFSVPSNPELRVRAKYIAAKFATFFKKLEEANEDYIIGIENTILPGKANQQLQRVIGAVLIVMPAHRPIIEVYPTQVKLHITGKGAGSDKKVVAEGLKKWFNNSDLLRLLTASSRWDATDAIGVAVTVNTLLKGIQSNVKKSQILPNVKLGKTKQKKLNKS